MMMIYFLFVNLVLLTQFLSNVSFSKIQNKWGQTAIEGKLFLNQVETWQFLFILYSFATNTY